MGAFLPRPITTTKTEKDAANGLKWMVCSMQGWRVDMEDAHISVGSLTDRLKNFSLFAVFDGHAGKKVAEDTASEFTKFLADTSPFNDEKFTDTNYDEQKIRAGIREAFRKWDKELKLRTTQQPSRDRSGSTATGVLITKKHFFFFNAGDSRTILVSDSKVTFSTEDHKPTNEAEKKRIEDAGGRVMIQRINGSLAVSRALGDFEYKNRDDLDDLHQLVSPDPDVTCKERNLDSDNFIVVACDGIYDVMNNEEIAEFCQDRIESSPDEDTVPETLLHLCLNKGSRDNMSAIIIGLDNYPKPNDEKIRKDKELDDKIVKKLNEYLQDSQNPETQRLDEFVTSLQQEDFILECPTIGGIETIVAKRGFITRQFEHFEHFDNLKKS